ncbi:hypothetical protein H8S95_05645 [Pontibacter sp. KCTC 32443]|uniref:toxin-antitoxin system YwqK family antitoxin n=1 Tax=Pontibacter TaxID=323449 RepID=UPI00164E85E7|nr:MULTISPECIES: hypothetical protein [Pontibacter]MBC5773539.1 hypothetical protein [Pontibacter sp. KCTC 32443]
MNRKCLYILFLMLLPTICTAQIAVPYKIKRWYNPFQVNAFDKNKEYHGRWKIYINDDKDLIRNGRFKHGKEVGTWRYYYPGGGLYMKEKYTRNSPVIQVWRYHENGNLAKSGNAKLYRDSTMAHYYWEGEWQVFDEQGNLTHTETYLKGNLLRYKD